MRQIVKRDGDMMEMADKIVLYFQYPFVRYAMIVGVLVALCSSLLGVTLVLKRFSFIGAGLSHVAFGAIAIATALRLTNNFYLVLPVTIISAILLLRSGQNAKIKGDAAVAMISVGSLAVGYLVMNLFSKSSNLTADVCSTLFGSTSILTLSATDVWLSVVLSIIVTAVFLMFYHKIFAITFDEDFSAATGVKTKTYNLILAVVIAVIIVLAMNLVGSLLISALVIFPAISAMRVFKSFKSVTICSVIFSTTCAAVGIIASILAGTPVGSTIVLIDIIGFLIFCIIGLVIRKH
jgi:zinc transport system permease protein